MYGIKRSDLEASYKMEAVFFLAVFFMLGLASCKKGEIKVASIEAGAKLVAEWHDGYVKKDETLGEAKQALYLGESSTVLDRIERAKEKGKIKSSELLVEGRSVITRLEEYVKKDDSLSVDQKVDRLLTTELLTKIIMESAYGKKAQAPPGSGILSK